MFSVICPIGTIISDREKDKEIIYTVKRHAHAFPVDQSMGNLKQSAIHGLSVRILSMGQLLEYVAASSNKRVVLPSIYVKLVHCWILHSVHISN